MIIDFVVITRTYLLRLLLYMYSFSFLVQNLKQYDTSADMEVVYNLSFVLICSVFGA